MSKIFQIMLSKDVDYIRITETIIRKLEIDGWRVSRDGSNKTVILTTKTVFGSLEKLTSHLRGILSKAEQLRVKIVGVK